MGAVIQEIFLDLLAFVAKANHEILDAMRGIRLHDVPQDGPPTDIHHGLGAKLGFGTKPGAATASQNHRFLDHEHSDTMNMRAA